MTMGKVRTRSLVAISSKQGRRLSRKRTRKKRINFPLRLDMGKRGVGKNVWLSRFGDVEKRPGATRKRKNGPNVPTPDAGTTYVSGKIVFREKEGGLKHRQETKNWSGVSFTFYVRENA